MQVRTDNIRTLKASAFSSCATALIYAVCHTRTDFCPFTRPRVLELTCRWLFVCRSVHCSCATQPAIRSDPESWEKAAVDIQITLAGMPASLHVSER